MRASSIAQPEPQATSVMHCCGAPLSQKQLQSLHVIGHVPFLITRNSTFVGIAFGHDDDSDRSTLIVPLSLHATRHARTTMRFTVDRSRVGARPRSSDRRETHLRPRSR